MHRGGARTTDEAHLARPKQASHETRERAALRPCVAARSPARLRGGFQQPLAFLDETRLGCLHLAYHMTVCVNLVTLTRAVYITDSLRSRTNNMHTLKNIEQISYTIRVQ